MLTFIFPPPTRPPAHCLLPACLSPPSRHLDYATAAEPMNSTGSTTKNDKKNTMNVKSQKQNKIEQRLTTVPKILKNGDSIFFPPPYYFPVVIGIVGEGIFFKFDVWKGSSRVTGPKIALIL